MKTGLTLRVALSHLLLVLVSLAIFLFALTFMTRGSFAAAEGRVDRATASRLAPLLEQLYERRGSWQGVGRALDAALPPAARMAPRPPERTMHRWASGSRDLPIAQPLVIIDDSGAMVAAVGARDGTDRADLRERIPDAREGQPIGPASNPYGWLFVGSMIPGTGNPLQVAISRILARAGLISAAAIVLLAAVVAASWSRWLLRPLNALEAASRSLAAGDYQARVGVPSGQHELRSLAESFNAMAQEIGLQEESRRRFVADAAHELRTPMALMQTRIQMLGEGVYDPTPEQWDALQRSAERMSELIEELQTLARLDAGRVNLEPCALAPADVFLRLTTEFGPVAVEAGVELVVASAHPDTPSVLADLRKLHQILANLLANAVRHTPAGGQVTLSAGLAPATHPPAVRLVVEDTGPGIPDAERERIFERFVRLDTARGRGRGGSGLGLAIARRLTELQGGTIRAESGPGGARFVVTLPSA